MSTSIPTPNLHIYFVLDRSGSMQSIASDVIGGFNAYVKQQQADGADALMTLVQFDSTDPHEVLANAVPINEIKQLDLSVFVPRGSTPLFDAMGRVLNEAISREAQLVGAEKPAESIVFVTFTDGGENASREFTRETVFNLVKGKEKDGWTFVYMGANQDAYATGGDMGMSHMNSSNFVPDDIGTKLAFEDLARSTSTRRSKLRTGEVFASGAFFEEGKTADQDAGERL
jgi:Mg-chelatase subunit ChlD